MRILRSILTSSAMLISIMSITSQAYADTIFSSPASVGKYFLPPATPGGASYEVSPDGRFRLVFQNDGNLVLYQGSTALWASNTVLHVPEDGYTVLNAQFQTDGNLVVYWYRSGAPVAMWASNTAGHPLATLRVQNDGNLVIADGTGTPIWASNTCCH